MEEEKKIESPESANTPPDIVPYGSSYIKPQGRQPHDPDITFEEYHWYALRTREEEKTAQAPKTEWRKILVGKKGHEAAGNGEQTPQVLTAEDFATREHRLEISDEEWTNASRAFRTAGWGACEYSNLGMECCYPTNVLTCSLI
jgi:hypothetical protein